MLSTFDRQLLRPLVGVALLAGLAPPAMAMDPHNAERNRVLPILQQVAQNHGQPAATWFGYATSLLNNGTIANEPAGLAAVDPDLKLSYIVARLMELELTAQCNFSHDGADAAVKAFGNKLKEVFNSASKDHRGKVSFSGVAPPNWHGPFFHKMPITITADLFPMGHAGCKVFLGQTGNNSNSTISYRQGLVNSIHNPQLRALIQQRAKRVTEVNSTFASCTTDSSKANNRSVYNCAESGSLLPAFNDAALNVTSGTAFYGMALKRQDDSDLYIAESDDENPPDAVFDFMEACGNCRPLYAVNKAGDFDANMSQEKVDERDKKRMAEETAEAERKKKDQAEKATQIKQAKQHAQASKQAAQSSDDDTLQSLNDFLDALNPQATTALETALGTKKGAGVRLAKIKLKTSRANLSAILAKYKNLNLNPNNAPDATKLGNDLKNIKS